MASTVAVYVCVVVMMSSSLPTELPLTPEKARYVFQNTRDLGELCRFLNIPDDKRNNAASASEHFIQSTEPMKVRRMIWSLDWDGDTALADTVMEWEDSSHPPKHITPLVIYQSLNVPPPPQFLQLLILPPQGHMSRLNPERYTDCGCVVDSSGAIAAV